MVHPDQEAVIPAAPFIAVVGQSFGGEQEWVNRAKRALTSHPQYHNTEHGETKGWRGAHFTALCFDQAGNRMRNGGDFMRATREGTYPVWWVWPDQLNGLLRAAADKARTAVEGPSVGTSNASEPKNTPANGDSQ